jgi:gluconate 2-dehydrogenase gamma chain
VSRTSRAGTLLSRRELLTRGALFGGTLAAALHLPRPRALAAAAESDAPVVLDPGAWKTVEAITARLIPTDHEPGAREAGCVNFIDKALAHEDAEQRPTYAAGLRGVDAAARKTSGKPFVELTLAQQDELLARLEEGKVAGWPDGGVGPEEFFAAIWLHTLWGFLADPKYGGNRDFAGWKVMGYPGPRHMRGGYTADQMAGRAQIDTLWGGTLPGVPPEPDPEA